MSQQGDIDPRSQRFHQYDVLVIPMTDEQKPVLIKDLRFQGIMQIGDPIYVEAGKRMGSYYNSNEDGLPEFESRYFEALGKSAQNLIHLGKVTGIVESDEEASELEAMSTGFLSSAQSSRTVSVVARFVLIVWTGSFTISCTPTAAAR